MACSIRRQPAERWHASERNVVKGLGQLDMVDAFRTLHGYGPSSVSGICVARESQWAGGLTVYFASKTLRLLEYRYLHNLRESGLSDPSGILEKFN